MNSREEVVRRALSLLDVRATYKLGMGGRDPDAPTPLDHRGRCDCSGALSWCFGLDRYHPGYEGGDWIWTNAMYQDARNDKPGLFESPDDNTDARDGDLAGILPGYGVVYPSGSGRRYGHCGVYVGGNDVVDCASGRGAGQAMAKRPLGFFIDRGAVVIRPVDWDDEDLVAPGLPGAELEWLRQNKGRLEALLASV